MLRKIGDALLVLGLLVGVGSIVGYQLDIIPTLPPAVLKLVLYKLIFVGGLGLLVAGAFIRRVADRDAHRDSYLKPGDAMDSLHPPRPGAPIPRSTSRSQDVL